MTISTQPVISRAQAVFNAMSTPRLVIAASVTLTLGITAVAFAAASHSVSQKGRAFPATNITIATGDTINFVNDDEFIHQIFVQSDGFKFDSAESEPGNTIPVIFPSAGNYQVRCHIHPKMLLKVTVK